MTKCLRFCAPLSLLVSQASCPPFVVSSASCLPFVVPSASVHRDRPGRSDMDGLLSPEAPQTLATDIYGERICLEHTRRRPAQIHTRLLRPDVRRRSVPDLGLRRLAAFCRSILDDGRLRVGSRAALDAVVYSAGHDYGAQSLPPAGLSWQVDGEALERRPHRGLLSRARHQRHQATQDPGRDRLGVAVSMSDLNLWECGRILGPGVSRSPDLLRRSLPPFLSEPRLEDGVWQFATPGWPRWSVLGILATTWILGFGAWIAVLYYTFQTWKGQLALALFNTWEPMYLITAGPPSARMLRRSDALTRGLAIFDVTYAVAFAFQLRRRIQHFNKDTDAHLRKLMRISLGAAAVTTVSAIVGASLATVYRGTELDVVFTPVSSPRTAPTSRC